MYTCYLMCIRVSGTSIKHDMTFFVLISHIWNYENMLTLFTKINYTMTLCDRVQDSHTKIARENDAVICFISQHNLPSHTF